MTKNYLTTNGSEFTLPDGRRYYGSYHVHIDKGAMVGAYHSKLPHASLKPVNPKARKKVKLIQNRLKNDRGAKTIQPQIQLRKQPARRTTPIARTSEQRTIRPLRPTPRRSSNRGSFTRRSTGYGGSSGY